MMCLYSDSPHINTPSQTMLHVLYFAEIGEKIGKCDVGGLNRSSGWGTTRGYQGRGFDPRSETLLVRVSEKETTLYQKALRGWFAE